ncbi:hypothetical protein [Winogradskyella sp. PE311]|uniref:hypothetical protein n=1 Tax=Winogradskyella sp. PE311 TaxID=3366943 RepID=UPI003980B484
MKNLITSLALVVTILGFSQSKSINGMVVKEMTKVENVSITVEVDSAEEIKETFKIESIKEILESSSDNETIGFKIICNGDKMSNGKKSHISYAIEGNSDDIEGFLKSVEKIRSSAINYYKNKN